MLKSSIVICLLVCLTSCKTTSIKLSNSGPTYVRTVDQKTFLRTEFEQEKQSRKIVLANKLANPHLLSRYTYDFVCTELTIQCNGSRNLMRVGIASEQQFKQLVKKMGSSWRLESFEGPAKDSGIDVKGMRIYWTPTSIQLEQGLVFATRMTNSNEIGALMFVKKYGKDQTEILIKTNPKAY